MSHVAHVNGSRDTSEWVMLQEAEEVFREEARLMQLDIHWALECARVVEEERRLALREVLTCPICVI